MGTHEDSIKSVYTLYKFLYLDDSRRGTTAVRSKAKKVPEHFDVVLNKRWT